MSLLGLPDEILELIAKRLDGFSLMAYGLCNYRLQRISLIRAEQLLGVRDVEQGMNRMLPVGWCVHSLDLSNRNERSSAIEGVILECPELRILNVVNSNLTFSQLMNILDHLERLDVMSCSMQGIPPDFLQERQVLKAQRSIRRLFIECSPSTAMFLYIARFLNRCKHIEYVHLNFVGRFHQPNQVFRVPFPAKSPRWRSLKTIVGSFHMSNRATLMTTLQVFLAFTGTVGRFCFTRQRMEFVPFSWWYAESLDAPEVVVTKDIDALRAKYEVENISIMFIPTLNASFRWPPDLVDLDLSFVPFCFPELNWMNLVSWTRNLKSLACHICYLPKGNDFSNMDLLGATQGSYVIRALETLKLTKLHLLVGTERYTNSDCRLCLSVSTCYILGDLDRLRYLEEFTLVGVIPSPLLYESIANSNVKAIRLCLRRSPSLKGLNELFRYCKCLKYFKFEAPNIPLHSPLLWESLGNVRPLNQICLASSSTGRVDLEMVRSFLPAIMETLEVFHLHADQHQALYDVIHQYVGSLNREKPHRNVQLLPRGIASLSDPDREALVWSMPGRNLCCTALIIGKIELDGWNIF